MLSTDSLSGEAEASKGRFELQTKILRRKIAHSSSPPFFTGCGSASVISGAM